MGLKRPIRALSGAAPIAFGGRGRAPGPGLPVKGIAAAVPRTEVPERNPYKEEKPS
jgi:hypothetical protein